MPKRAALVLGMLVLVLLGALPARAQVRGAEVALLSGSPPARSARHGAGVAISADGTRALIAADDGAHFFEFDGEHWTEVHSIPPPSSSRARAGAVALSADGQTALIGWPRENRRGAVYVYSRLGSGWVEADVLTSPNARVADEFGHAVALSADGSVAVIGAPQNVHGAGSCARVFRRHAHGWSHEAALRLDEPLPGGRLGAAVAIDAAGARVILGAPGVDLNGERDSGLASVFAWDGSAWRHLFTFNATSPARGDRFGEAVAISGDGVDVLIGAPGDDLDGHRDAGSVWSFSSTGAPFSPPGVALHDPRHRGFGRSIAISADGRRAIVGADEGNARLLVRGPEGWRGGPWLAAASARDGGSFEAAALSGDGRVALLGAPRDGVRGYDASGSARVFSLSDDDGTGLRTASVSEDERRDAEREADEAEAQATDRNLVLSLGVLPALVGVAAYAYFVPVVLDTGVPPGSTLGDAFAWAFGLAFGIPILGVACVFLPAVIVTGFGELMGGRGNFFGTLFGTAVGGVLAALSIAGVASLSPDSNDPLMVTASLGAVMVGLGAVLGYSLWDAAERGEAAEVLSVPMVEIGPDGAMIGAHGRF